MRLIPIALALLALFSLPFAQNYTNAYSNGWANVTRNVEVLDPLGCAGGIAGVCASTGASAGAASYITYVNLTIQNIGPADRQGVEIAESLLSVPSGARITFRPLPADSAGRSASWRFDLLKSGESKTVSYTFPARMGAGEAEKIGEPIVSSQPPKAMLFAPSASEVGGRVTLTLQTLSGQPLAGTIVTVGYPDGTSQDMRADYRGKVSFNAPVEGPYTYEVPGYDLGRAVSTQVQPKEEIPPIAAAAVGLDTSIAQLFSGMLPILAAIFGVAVLALVIYNFFSSREGEEQRSEAPSEPPVQQYYSAPPAEGPVYTQKFSFASGGAENDEQKMRDVTRGLVENRKKRMQASEVASAEPQHNNKHSYEERESLEAAPEEIENDAEESEDAELAREIEKLEAQARSEGEITEQEDEIEKAIAELEEIRKKLRDRRDQVMEIGERLGGEAGDDEGPAPTTAPSPRQKPRVMPPTARVKPSVPQIKKK